MAVYDNNFEWTPEAEILDNELRSKLTPIINNAIEQGLRVEDVQYIVNYYVFEWAIDTVLWTRHKMNKEKNHV